MKSYGQDGGRKVDWLGSCEGIVVRPRVGVLDLESEKDRWAGLAFGRCFRARSSMPRVGLIWI